MVVAGAPTAFVAPRVTPAAAPRTAPLWWRYLERTHAHEVLAEWRVADGMLHIRETDPAAPDSRIDAELAVAQPWETRVALWQLECRLSALGSYWQQRSTDGGWGALARPGGAPDPDMRANMVIDRSHAPLVHHYHDELGSGDHLVAALRGAQPQRFVILRAQLDVPALTIGRIDILHPSLSVSMSKSIVMREQLALMQAGLGKLVAQSDYERSFGDDGRRAARLVDEVMTRVREGALARPERKLDESDVYAEFLITINDPRLRALHTRFLAPGDEERLLAAGPIAIRKYVAQKRGGVKHDTQHLLTILEASLLARERIRTGQLLAGDPEVRNLTHLAYYL